MVSMFNNSASIKPLSYFTPKPETSIAKIIYTAKFIIIQNNKQRNSATRAMPQ